MRPRCKAHRPARGLIEAIASEEGAASGRGLLAVLAALDHGSVAARKRAWVRLVREHGFTILGVAEVWGCHRRGIQRALREAA